MNLCLLTGRLTKNPELQKSADGQTSYCRFNVAVNRGKNKKGEEITDFPTVTAFGKIAENMCKYLEKGCMIAVDAQLHTNKYEKDGKTNYGEELIANKIEFIEWKKKSKEEPKVISIPEEVSSEQSDQKITDDDVPF